MVQEFYYRLMSAPTRQAMHRRAARYYEVEAADILQAVYHLMPAGAQQHAASLLLPALQTLINQGYVRALGELLDGFQESQVQPEQWVALTIARGDVHALLRTERTAHECYLAAYQQLAAMPSWADARSYKARICRGMGRLLEHESAPQALEWLSHGLDAIADAEPLEEALLHQRIGSVLIAAGKYHAAREALEYSLQRLPGSAEEWRASVWQKLGVVHYILGNIPTSKDYYLRALEGYQHSHNYWKMIGVQHDLAITMESTGEWDAAAATYQQAWETARRLESLTHQTNIEISLGVFALKRDDLAAAVRYLNTSIERARQHHLQEQLVQAQATLIDASLRAGNLTTAVALLDHTEQLAQELHIRGVQPELCRSRACLALFHELPADAVTFAEQAVAAANALDAPVEAGIGLRLLGQALIAAGRVTEAFTAFDQSLALLNERDLYETACTQEQWGRALLHSPQAELGTAMLLAADTTFARLGVRRPRDH
jgi:tetratricopeptide (TPR) repeat protein